MTTSTEHFNAGDLAVLRGDFYRYFALAFLSPGPDRVRAVQEMCRQLSEQPIDSFAFSLSWRELCDEVCVAGPETSMPRDFVKLFVVHAGASLCPIHESQFRTTPGADTGTMVASLTREYAEIGVDVQTEGGTQPDHAAVELEVMSYLCDKEAECWENGSPTAAGEYLETQRDFVATHLVDWFAFLAATIEKALPGSAYAPLARAAHAFVVHDEGYARFVQTAITAAGSGANEN